MTVWQKLKLGFLAVFNRKSAYEYALDLGNNAVASLSDATKDKIAEVRRVLAAISAVTMIIRDFLPEAWFPYADAADNALRSVVDATEDMQLTPEELNTIADKFRVAYALYKAD